MYPLSELRLADNAASANWHRPFRAQNDALSADELQFDFRQFHEDQRKMSLESAGGSIAADQSASDRMKPVK